MLNCVTVHRLRNAGDGEKDGQGEEGEETDRRHEGDTKETKKQRRDGNKTVNLCSITGRAPGSGEQNAPPGISKCSSESHSP